MQSSKASEIPENQSREIAVRVREELARRRISRARLAEDAKISLSTLEKVLNGSRPFTLATIVRLEEALDLKLHTIHPVATEKSTGAAPASLGGYTAAAVAWLEGDYLTLRASFEIKDALFAYRTRIAWNKEHGSLGFEEFERLDAPFSQKGEVSIPNKSGQVYLHTNDDGQIRLAILCRPLKGGEMYGLLTTLIAGAGGRLQPVSTPLVLLPIKNTAGQFGRIAPGSKAYAEYQSHLVRAVADDYVRLILP